MLTRAQAIKSDGKCPRDKYYLRGKTQSFKKNSAGNPMITINFEMMGYPMPDGTLAEVIPNPENPDEKVQVAGREVPYYLTIKEGQALDRFFEFQKKFGLNDQEVDETDPLKNNDYTKIQCEAILDCDEMVMRKNPTPEQEKEGKLGDVILDKNGKEIVTYRPKIVTILGPVEFNTNRPY